jgi:threonine aldolase
VLDAELGTAAWIAGGMPKPLPHDAGPGKISASAVLRAAGSPGPYYTLRTSLLCLENTHMAAGGVVTEVDEHAALAAAARRAGLKVHLDGARLWHASVALGLPPAALTVGVDTVQVCLSKGLGAPVGSVVAGSVEFVEEARRLRKMLGGGVRQGGVLAAAGLVALNNIERLAEDHQRAARLAAGLADRGWRVTVPATNIVLLTPADLPSMLRQLEQAGVRAGPMGNQVRFVTHGDLTDDDIDTVLTRIGPVDTGISAPRRPA